MAQNTDVVIVGSGPYGLSMAAHLRARGIKYRVFGDPMRFWRNMPHGVNLKSLAFATNIYVPGQGYSYPKWCLEHGLEDFEPCTMQSFAAYGCEMQKRFIPDLEEVFVTNVRRQDRKFEVTLATGERFFANKVVSCTGLSGLAHIPVPLRHLGPEYMRHTFDVSDYGEFKGKTVAVIGAGASAIEAGALVRESGGTSEVFVRGPEAVFHGRTPRERSLWQRMKTPTSVLGASRRGWILEHLPWLVYRLPVQRRTRFVKAQLGPASPWWIQDRVEGKVPIHVQHELTGASMVGNRVHLKFRDGAGQTQTTDVDFVIAGTGYDVDVSRLPYIDREMLPSIRCIDRAPDLNRHFESSVPGLYFLGTLSYMCFGPLFRFVCGAEKAVPRVARRLG
jgi:thioredoxin reductase